MAIADNESFLCAGIVRTTSTSSTLTNKYLNKHCNLLVVKTKPFSNTNLNLQPTYFTEFDKKKG